MPAVLVDSSGPPAGGIAGPGALEPRQSPLNAQAKGDGLVRGNQPISDQHNFYQPIISKDHDVTTPSTTESTPADTRRGAPVAPNGRAKTYADILAAAVDRAESSQYQPIFTRPSADMIAHLRARALDDSCDDSALLFAMDAAIPYERKEGRATFWVETGTALQSMSNDKIIARIFEENDSKDWANLLGNFVQVYKARSGNLVVT
ncbi:hypothetical protein As57867_007343, partial [Aphanomyces stellatus]